jgi:uncharacterized protein
MNTIKQLFSMALLITAMITNGQNKTTNSHEKPYIEVNGTAEKEIVPDEIYIAIVIREKYENRVKVTIDNQEEKLINAIRSLGIEGSNLYLSDANADYVKIKWHRKDVLTKKDYLLKVTNATTVGQVFQKLEEIEINDAYISKVSHSNIDNLRKEIRILAIKAAKEKADYLLNAIGEKTGKALIVNEKNQNTITQRNISANTFSVNETKSNALSNYEIQFQKIKLTASIYVKFSIEE